MSFLWREALLLLLAAPLLAAAIYLRARPRRIPGLEMPSANRWQRHLPPALYIAALVVAALAAARPTALITLPSQQRTIIMAIDVSLSMRASDVQPNRLAAAQAAARDFIKEQPGDVRLGIVSFAGTAIVVQQPTHERDELIAAIDRLQLDRHTAIGSGIIVSLAALFPNDGIDVESFGKKAREPRELKPVPPGSNPNAAIILLTDGRRTIGPDPVQAARMAADRGVRVYTVGFGSAQGGPVQVEGYSIYMMFDEATLKSIAEITNAEYFHATSGAELKKIYDSLTAKFVLQREQTEITAFFAAAAAALLIAAAGLSLAWFNRIL
jgi:Ca-activated chloride channel homolog